MTLPLSKAEKTVIFVDGANLYGAARALDFDIDYKRLLQNLRERSNLLRAYYYTALVEDQDYSPIRPLVDWLDYNGYRVVTKPAREFTDAQGRRRFRGSMDMELAVEMMEIAPKVDHIILFSGNGEFKALVAALQRKGVRMTVVSTIKSQPPMISDELRRQADHFVDLLSLKDAVGRDPASRPAREQEDDYEYDDDEYEDDYEYED